VILDHLVKAEEADYVPDVVNNASATPLDKATPAQTLNAQKKTADWLTQITEDDDEILTEAQEAKVINTFNALTQVDPKAKEKLLELEVPEEVKSVVGMVTAYQWKFVEQANELRSMAVTKIAKETEHPDARIRLKALELLGKVTEVALFTDRVEVKREELSDEELEKRIKAKLERYMGVVDVVDTEIDETEEADIEVLPKNNE
jgi:delta 1-pyrroline-5-carboxylate dehydrogenase